MRERHDNIVLFPKQKKNLEEKAFHAMHERNYEKAIDYFQELLDFGITDQAILLGKLTSLIELGRQDEAEELCEDLIARKDEHYFSYINVYATLLFQFHKHKDVAKLLEETLSTEKIPSILRSQFEKLYEVNRPLVNEQIEQEEKITKRELIEAFQANDSLAQWHLVNHLQNADITPYISLFEKMLIDQKVNPVIKTVIVGLLQAKSIDQSFKVIKFNTEVEINPSTFPFKNDHPFRIAFGEVMEEYEQQNPTFYQLCEQLIDRFFYVLYPLTPKMSDLMLTRDAMIAIVESSFESKSQLTEEYYSKEILTMANQIIELEKIYFSIIEE
ncbi:DUF3196 family protein [Amphibacillus xylanus]|uniref:TPR repeat-containing protein n=1 Tax=Amphibacillus xylanus (strain ATCC 51415 / DSM 6626 / JCM 7361 / LMG 17667 / NBRC 15112 / Ep01) TaxID=698758 RepID=K0J3J3_AMPXN|nr:DUF3196 family protein [Amphibacillus xylanus]BAM47121.1 hypothetical protein AXY_09890 [Amphibacillus xylanus NBRC 15112]